MTDSFEKGFISKLSSKKRAIPIPLVTFAEDQLLSEEGGGGVKKMTGEDRFLS